MEFMINKKSKQKKVIDDGLVFFDDSSDCFFKIQNQSNSDDFLQVILCFKKDESKKTEMRKRITGDQTLVIECINFSNNGTGTKEPMVLGWFEDGDKKIKVSIHFWYYKMSSNSPIKLEYTIFAEAEDNGSNI